MTAFTNFFQRIAGSTPWDWQRELGESSGCTDRLLRIPTGFGKTAGTVLTWLFHRLERDDSAWPKRLVFCLPMRVLVEQTHQNIEHWLKAANLSTEVGLHVLMGGVEAAPWVMEADRPAILVGTQDMLLSRALMRGYASARGRWPMEFGLLNTDTLWIVDEVQLMGVGLATSAQLAAFRSAAPSESLGLRPARTWWMSATLQPAWLGTVDFAPQASQLISAQTKIPPAKRKGGLFEVQRKLTRDAGANEPDELAQLVRERHEPATLALVIVNTVRTAVAVADALRRQPKRKDKKAPAESVDIRLVHGRFRGAERQAWSRQFLTRSPAVPIPPAGRIIVATQVVEAGVDVSARQLVTQLAPWPSLVQRFGRCARYEGEEGAIVVTGSVPGKDAEAAPYLASELEAANAALERLGDDAGPASLERFEEALPDNQRAQLFAYAPSRVLRSKDLDDLFDTTADLSGADLDVGCYLRDGDERDVSVFWRDVDPDVRQLDDQPFPTRDELCPAPLFGKGGFEDDWLKKDRSAWSWDYLDETWRKLRRRPQPGAVVMLSAREGGYGELGWDPDSREPVAVLPLVDDPAAQQAERASSGVGDDSLSHAQWQSIADHGQQVGAQARTHAAAAGLNPRFQDLLELAGRWHDAGKAHREFQARIDLTNADRAPTGGWAKAPKSAWRGGRRRGFRHELASTLMLFEAAAASNPKHPALAEGVREVLDAVGQPPLAAPATRDTPLHRELAVLSPSEFDLVAFLVCAHHGKARLQWAPSVHDIEHAGRILGIDDGEDVPEVMLPYAGGHEVLPATALHLDGAALGANPRYGASWSERVEGLIARLGPFQLAYLEALLRAADWKASSAAGGQS